MILTDLELTHYRSYSHVSISFDKKVNILIGKNGAGKTNLAEAVQFLSLARSFRTSQDQDLIQKGQEFAKIKAKIQRQGRFHTLEVVITNQGKKILLNQKPIKKLSELSNIMHVLFFEPKDVAMFDDLPKVRRTFLDTHISKHQANYLSLLTAFEAILDQRNALLKQTHPDVQHLDVLTKQLIDASYLIVTSRQSYIQQLNLVIGKITSAVKGQPVDITLQYVPYVSLDKNFFTTASQLFKLKREEELRRKTTQIGPHREDFVAIYNQNTIATYGSQGENRLAAIALKIAPYFLLENHDQRPIIVLDDVLSELDQNTQIRLLDFLQKLQQVFITTTTIPKTKATIYHIQNSHILRRA
jgi:DNA replication and repair protein RecF